MVDRPPKARRIRPSSSVAGVPLHLTPAFVAVAVMLGLLAGRDIAAASLIHLPRFASVQEALRAFEAGGPMAAVTTPSSLWVVAGGLGVAVVYALSVLAHEWGHLTAARLVGVDVAAVRLHALGGFVEIADEDWLTAGRLAVIAGAGPLTTAVLVLVSGAVLTTLGWPLTGVPDVDTGAGVALGRVLSGGFVLNLLGLVTNLLPIRPLDGGHLLAAARLRRAR